MCVHACIRCARMGHGGPVITIRGSGLLCVCTGVCGVLSVHVTACGINNRMSQVSVTLPLFLCVSSVLSLVTVSFCKPVCMWPAPYLCLMCELLDLSFW